VSSRPLERLPTIRAKLGSTIVFAVVVTILLSYILIAFQLRNSPRSSEAIDTLSLARKAAAGRLTSIPDNMTVVTRTPDGSRTRARTSTYSLPCSPTVSRIGASWGV
jgi:hypothetical protein